MKALVGLGNPGPEYAATRHNLGFRVAETFAARHGARRFAAEGPMLAARVRFAGEDVLVVKPTTYMNRSGAAVRVVVHGHGASGEDLVVAHDDLDLDLGAVRVKLGGGHGGHNGLRSILEEGEAGDFVRVRLGVKRPDPAVDAATWVLTPFPAAEAGQVDGMVEQGADAVEAVLRLGAGRAMNEWNRRPRPATAGAAQSAPEGQAGIVRPQG